MGYRLGEAVEYDPFADEEEHAGKDFSLGDPVDYDPFAEEEDKSFLTKAKEFIISDEPRSPGKDFAERQAAREAEAAEEPPAVEPLAKLRAAREGQPPDQAPAGPDLLAPTQMPEDYQAPPMPEMAFDPRAIDPRTGAPYTEEQWREKQWRDELNLKQFRQENGLPEDWQPGPRETPLTLKDIGESLKKAWEWTGIKLDTDIRGLGITEHQIAQAEEKQQAKEAERQNMIDTGLMDPEPDPPIEGALDPESGQRAERDLTGEDEKGFFNEFVGRAPSGLMQNAQNLRAGMWRTNYLLHVKYDSNQRKTVDSVMDQLARQAHPGDAQKQGAYKTRLGQEISDIWDAGASADQFIFQQAGRMNLHLREDPQALAVLLKPPQNMAEIRKKSGERLAAVEKTLQEFYKNNPEYQLPEDWNDLTDLQREVKYPGIYWGENVFSNGLNSVASISAYMATAALTRNHAAATLMAGAVMYPQFVNEIAQELDRMEKEEGIKVSDELKADLSLFGAFPSAMIEGMSERIGFGPHLSKHFAKNVGKKAMIKKILDAARKNALAKKGYQVGVRPAIWGVKQAAAGGAEEGSQQGIANVAAQIAGSERDIMEGVKQAAKVGAVIEPVLGGPMKAIDVTAKGYKVRKAKKEISKAQEQIDRILKDYEDQTSEDILLDDDLAPAAEGPAVDEPERDTVFKGDESAEAEETAEQFTPEELEAAAAKAEEVAPEPAPTPAAKPTPAPRMGEKPTAAVKRIWGVPELVGGPRVAPTRTEEPWNLPAKKRPEEIQRIKEIWQGKRAPESGGVIEDVSLPPAKTRISPTGRRQVMQSYADSLGKGSGAKIRFDNVVFQDNKPVGLQMTVTDGPAKGARFTISDRAHKTRAQAQAFVDNIIAAYTQAAPTAPALAPKKKAPAKDAQAELDQLVQTLNDEQKAAVKDLIEWTDMPVDQRLGLMRAELATLDQKKALKEGKPKETVIPTAKAAPKKPAEIPPTPPAAPPKVEPGEPLIETTDVPGPSPGDRWTTDPGAIPGEPLHFLDQTPGVEDDSQAAIIEHEVEDGSLFELVDADGRSLGMFKDAKSAAQEAEDRFEAPAKPEAPPEKAPAEEPAVLPGGPRVAPVRTTEGEAPAAPETVTIRLDPDYAEAGKTVDDILQMIKGIRRGEKMAANRGLAISELWALNFDYFKTAPPEVKKALSDKWQKITEGITQAGAPIAEAEWETGPALNEWGETWADWLAELEAERKEYEKDREIEAAAKAEEEPEPAPEIEGAFHGEAVKIITPQNAEGYDAEYVVYEFDWMVPSHSAETFQKNEEYPSGVQERAYHSDTTEQAKVIEHAQKLDSRILLSDDPTPTNGPPITSAAGYVLSGNSRAMSIQRAFSDDKKAAKYKNQLIAQASKFGLAPKDIKGMKKPVLVRMISDPTVDTNKETMRSLAREFNQTLTAGMGEAAEIASMGKSISIKTMGFISERLADKQISLRELLGKKDGMDILGWLIFDGAIDMTDKNVYVNKEGTLLNKRGKETIESAIFGNIIDDLDLINSAQKSHLNKIEKALAPLAKVKGRGGEWNIAPDLKEALRLATAAQARDVSVREYLKQQPLFGDAPKFSETAIGLADLLIKDKPTKWKDRWTGYSIDAVADTKKQAQMFKPKSQVDSLKEHFGIEAGAPPAAPAAAPAGEITNFFSGASRISDMQGHIAAGVPIGVEIGEVSKNGEAALVQYLKDGGQVFVDSGAYTAYRKKEQVNWPAVLKNYMRIAQAAGDGAKNLVVAAPDVIADSFKTIQMTNKYSRELNQLAARGVSIVLPVHQLPEGPDVKATLADVWGNMESAIDPEYKDRAIAGFPMKVNPIRPEQVKTIFSYLRPPTRVHLLGVSPKNPEVYNAIIEAIHKEDPNVEILADANRLRAQLGRLIRPEIFAARAAKKANEGQFKDRPDYMDLMPEYETRPGFDYGALPEGVNVDDLYTIGKVNGLPDDFISEFIYLVEGGSLAEAVNKATAEGEWEDQGMLIFKEFHDIVSLGADQIAPAMTRADLVKQAAEWEKEKEAELAARQKEREEHDERIRKAAKGKPTAPKLKSEGEVLADRIRAGNVNLERDLDQYKLPILVKAAQVLGIRATGKKPRVLARIQKDAPAIIEAATKEYAGDQAISIANDIIPEFSGAYWKDRYADWKRTTDYEAETAGTELRPEAAQKLDEQIFRLMDYVDKAYGDPEAVIIVEFEHAYAVGSVREILNYRYRGLSAGERGAKTGWGDTIHLWDPAAVEVPEKPAMPGILNMAYWLKDTSSIKQKAITRNELKGILKKNKLKIGPFKSVGQLNKGRLQEWLDKGGDFGKSIQKLLDVTGLDLGGLFRAFKNGDMALIERLATEGNLAPASYITGESKFDGPREKVEIEAPLLGADAGQLKLIITGQIPITRENLNLSKKYLQSLAVALGFPKSGTKEQITDRILELKELRDSIAAMTDPAEYTERWSKEELKAMAATAKVWKSGNKRQLAISLMTWAARSVQRGKAEVAAALGAAAEGKGRDIEDISDNLWEKLGLMYAPEITPELTAEIPEAERQAAPGEIEAPTELAGELIEGHLQTPDRHDRWWTHLIRARYAAADAGITSEDVDWADLDSIVAAIDAHDQATRPAVEIKETFDIFEIEKNLDRFMNARGKRARTEYTSSAIKPVIWYAEHLASDTKYYNELQRQLASYELTNKDELTVYIGHHKDTPAWMDDFSNAVLDKSDAWDYYDSLIPGQQPPKSDWKISKLKISPRDIIGIGSADEQEFIIRVPYGGAEAAAAPAALEVGDTVRFKTGSDTRLKRVEKINEVGYVQVTGSDVFYDPDDFEIHTPEAPAAAAPVAPVAAKKPAPEHEKREGSAALGGWIEEQLTDKQDFTWRQLFKEADKAFGGTQAQGVYTPKDAYDAMELGVNLWLQTDMRHMGGRESAEIATERVKELKDRINKLPTQTKRTREQGEFQQFSTPPPLAYVANWVANITETDSYLEPSAGVGGLAVFAQNAGAGNIAVNELDPRRASLLGELGFTEVYTEDASQLDNILPEDVKPTVIVMNPPFSATAGRLKGTRATKFGAQQIEQALNRLADGGRLVAIVGKGMGSQEPGFQSWWKKINRDYTVRANVRVSGQEYKKYGTTFDNQMLVIDKIGPTDYNLVKGKVEKIEDLIPILEAVKNERQELLRPGAETKPIAGQPPGARIPAGEQPGAEPGPAVDTAAGTVGPGERPGTTPEPTAGQTGRTGELETEPGGEIPKPQRAEPGRGETERPGDEPGERAGPGAIGKPAGVPTPTGGELSLEQLDALIDDVFEQETAKKKPAKKAAAPKVAAAPAGPTAAKLPTSREDAYKQIAGIISGLPQKTELKETPLSYGTTQPLLHPTAYEQARPVLEFAYNDFIGTEDATEERAREWIADAFNGLSKYDIDPAVLKNWIMHYYANDRPGVLPSSTPAKEEKQPEIKKAKKQREDITASLYEDYTGSVTGATKHPTPLVETAALADTDFPELTYKIDLPAKVLKPKKAGMGISDIQLEAAILAGQAHDQRLVDGRRRGVFLGHGTGVGKGRIISSIIMDNWNKGRKKAIWISEKASLETDAKRDLLSTGWPEGAKALFNLNKTKLENKVKGRDQGIMFSTYSTLASNFSKIDPNKPETLDDLRVRLNQIREWLGEDFDGIIAFDESHNMANSTAQQGTMGKTTPAQKALAGIMLEELFPNARLMYVSATGATEVSNMAYLSRLGLWGEGTAFANQRQFVNSISGSGLAAMEMIARSLKANGLYTAPSLSYDGVNYDRLEHDLTTEQAETYDTIARSWQIIMKNTERALDITNANLSGGAKRAAHSKLWGTQQRVFNQIITAMQLPTMITKIEKDLAAGDSAVIQIVNTNDAQAQRAFGGRKEGEEIEDLDFTPRRAVHEYLEKAFPTDQYEEYTDDKGRKKVRQVFDSDGNAVENREAVAMREAMLQDLRRLSMPDSPLDQLISVFGPEKIAEMTGRKSRVIIDPETGKKKEQKWSKSKALKDVDAFNDDKKQILIFSEAGGTGASYHADRTFKNQRIRRHYLLQAGWTASKAVQGLGRTHRSNQKQAPEYFLVTTNLKAQKRFISSIARRLDQLGALTKGQRQAGSQGIFQARDNLESDYARDALARFYQDLADGKIEGMTWQQWEEMSGTKIIDEDTGKLYAQTPDMIRTMNRMLSMEIEFQNIAFDAFSKNLDRVIQEHADAGTLDVGIETITGLEVEKVSEKVVHTVEATGSTANYVRVKVTNPSIKIPFDDVSHLDFYQNIKSGRMWAASAPRETTTKSGAIVKYHILRSPSDTTQRQEAPNLNDAKKWNKIDKKLAVDAWTAEYNHIPENTDRTIDMLTGDLLPIWDRLTGFATVYRLQTDAGERLLGRVLAPNSVDTILERLGVSAEKVEVKSKDLGHKILAGGRATLANGWELKKSMVSGDERIELIGPRGGEIDLLEKQGAFVENINYKDRIFIPTGAESTKVFDRILVNRPVVKLITAYQGPRLADTELNDASTAFAGKVAKKIKTGKKATQLDLFDYAKKAESIKAVEAIPDPTQQVEVRSTGQMDFESHVIASVEDAAAFIQPITEQAQEKAYMISTDAQGNIKEVHFMGKGTRGAVGIGVVETVGRLFNTPGVTKAYFVHNHPSAETVPSPEDRAMAYTMIEMAAAGGVEIENIIVGGDQWAHYNPISAAPSIKKTGKIRKTTRKTKIPVVERFIKRGKERGAYIDNSQKLTAHLEKYYNDREGYLFLNNKLMDLGFMEFVPGQTAAETTRDIIAEGERLNATVFILNAKVKDDTQLQSRMKFVTEWNENVGGNLMQIFEVRVNGESLADKGAVPQPKKAEDILAQKVQPITFDYILSDNPVFASKTVAPETPQTVEDVNMMANAVTAQWARGGPAIKVYRTQEGLPQVVKDYLKGENREADIITGAYFDNTIFLVAENLGSNEETALTILHEGFGHHGLRGTLGQDVFPVLRDLYIAKKKEVDAIGAELGIDTGSLDGQMQAAEEWFANQAQVGIESKWYDRLVRAIKNWIRKLGLEIRISNSEIRALIAAARQFTLTGQKVTAHPGAVPAFKKKKYGKEINWEENLSDEQRRRIKAAKGVGKRGLLEKASEAWEDLKAERQHFPHLQKVEDETLRHKMADVLRVHQEIPEVAKQKTADVMREFIKDLSSDGYDVYTMNIILADMLRDVETGLLNNEMLGVNETLPFGFESVEEIQEAYRKFQRLAEIHPEIGEALAARKKYIDNMVRQLVKYKILKKEVLKHKDYYHHQVLKYWGTKDQKAGGVATGSADVRKHWRPWMQARKGSLLDYNTEYVEAEFVALSQQLGQLETAKTLQRIKREADIYSDLKDDAKAKNLTNFYKQEAEKLTDIFKTPITPQEVMTDSKLDPLAGYKQKIAMSINALEGLAYKGNLGGDSEWQEIIEGLAMAHEDKKEDREGVFSPIPDGRLFDYLAYLVRTGQPGASWAATIFKNIHARNNHIKDALGKNFLTYDQLIPEGYIEWKPEPGKTTFWANTMADNVLQQVIKGERALTDKDVNQVMVKGRDIVWVIPTGLAETMDNFKDHPATQRLAKIADASLRAWKMYILINPLRVLKYNLNNMSGDLDITLAYNPKILKHFRGALRDLRAFNKGKAGKSLKAELDLARKLGVIGSGWAVQEVEDVTKQMGIDKFTRNIIMGEKPNLAVRYWETAKGATTTRENILRLAAFRHFKAEVAKGRTVYGASKVKEIDAIKDDTERSAKLARELVGDYGNISHSGQYIRKRLMPFYSWMEINSPRYVYMLRNVRYEGREAGARPLAILGKKALTRGVIFGVKAMMLYSLITLYNRIRFPDEEDELGEAGRRQLHLILGRRADGTISTIRFQGAFSDTLSFFGLEDWPHDLDDLIKSEHLGKTVQEKLIEIPEAFGTRLFHAIRPEPKLLGESLLGYATYPNPRAPRPIRDTAEHVLRTFSLDSIYRRAAGKPGRGKNMATHFLADLKRVIVYNSDPGEQAYYDTRRMVFDWKKDKGIEVSYGKPTNRGNALYYYKQALRYGDFKAAERYLVKYYELGGKRRGLKTAIDQSHPLAGIKQIKRRAFRKGLSPNQQKTLERALQWYTLTYRKNAPRELRMRARKTYLDRKRERENL